MKDIDKGFDKFDKKVTSKLNSTSTAKGWSDLLTIMRDILSLLSKNNNYDFSKITDKNILAKRLSQGLNPECPSGLHEVTLEVYQIILSNISQKYNNKLMDNLYLFAYGLFPFFPNATINNKKYFMEKIVEPIFLNLNKEELKLCLPGLLSSLIPGLDDNNEQTTKLIFKTFDKFISNNNHEMERDFFGIYWMLLLRCQHLRSSGIKYLLEKIIKYQVLVSGENDKKEIIDRQFPNINTTVVNALCEIIKEKDIPTVRNGMDFIISRIPLTQKNDMIEDKAKINLIISALHLLIKHEDSTVRRLKNWLLGLNGPDDEVDFNTEDMKYKMNLVIEAFKIIFNSDKNLEEEELLSNIKIIHKLFESEEEFIKLVMPKVSYIILKAVVNYWELELECSESVENNPIIEQIKLLFYINDICFDYFWKSVAESIKELSQENIEEKNLQKRINEVLSPLRFCLIFIDMQSNSKRIQYYIPIITNLLDIMKKLPLKRDNFKYIRTVIIIVLAFVKSLQEAKFHDPNEEQVAKIINQKENAKKEKTTNYEIVDKVPEGNERGNYNLKVRNSVISLINEDEEEKVKDEDENDSSKDVYNICEMSTINYILNNDKYNTIMENLTNNISKFHEYYINILNEFLNITNQVTKFEIVFFRQCCELIIRLQEYSQEKEDKVPKWFSYLEKIIFNSNYENMSLSIEATNVLIDLYFSSSLKNKIFLKIKNNFKSEEIDKETINELKIDDIVNRINVQNICLDLLVAKFYLLSSKQSNLTMIIELLINLYKCDNNKFIKIINDTFNSDKNLIKNIKLFSNFWKLANEYHPEKKFFLNGECIFEMIDLLDNKTPILRSISKSWLNQSNQCYEKIIDPILLVLLDKDITYTRDEQANTSSFTKEFDTSKILDAFIKLKNIILNSNIMKFLKENKPSEKVIQTINFKSFAKDDMFYIQILISITLHYIRTKPLDNLKDQFKDDVVSVNAASCELLEFFLSKISDKAFLIKNNEIITETILDLLKIYLDEKDEVMPTQLLEVLKILFYSETNPNFYKRYKSKYISFLINNRQLEDVLISGMTSHSFYIREHFISFTKICVEKIISIISVDDKEELQSFYDLCNKFIQPLSDLLQTRIKIDEIGRDDTEHYSHYDKKCNQIIFKNYCEEYKEYKKFDDDDIISILKGINDIISFCLKNDILDQANKSGSKKLVKIIFIPIPFIKKRALWLNMGYSGDWGAYKKELNNSLKNSNPFTNFLTSIIDINDEKPSNEVNNMSTTLYHNQIFNLLNSFLSIWVNQSDKYEAYDYCLNSNGILPPNIDSKKNLSLKQINYAKKIIKNNPIKQYIISIAMNLFLTDSMKFIENILQLWCVDSNNDKQYKLSIIELLISMDIPLDIILFCVDVIIQKKMALNKDKYIKNTAERCYETPSKQSIEEAKYFHFIYSYLLINPNIYIKKEDENEIIEIWREIINILNNSMNNTKILYSFCWMYEIIQLASEKFKLTNIDNREIKNGIESIFSYITNKLIDAIFLDKQDSKYVKNSSLVLPFLPHIYYNIVKILYKNDNLYQKNLEGSSRNKNNKSSDNQGNDRANKNNLNLFLNNNYQESNSIDNRINIKKKVKTFIGSNQTIQAEILNKFNSMSNIIYSFYMKYINNAKLSSPYNNTKNPKSLDHKLLNENYKHLAFITLKENFYSIVKNLFDDNLNICKKYYVDIVNKSLNYLKKSDSSDFKAEIASDFLVDLMENTPKNITSCSKSALMDYINSNSLFKVTPRELHKWRIIISQLRENYPDILVDLIKDMQDKNIFVKKTEEDKKRILRRVSFVIYSCEKDKFDKNFGLIKSKAKELLSEYSNNNSLEDEIFLILRMLFLRFSHDGVMQMIRELWPIIFTELIQNIKSGSKSKKNNLLLESLKFVELLSLVNIEEFSLYQWIFMIDTFDMDNLDFTKKDSLISKIKSNQEELFRPLILEIVGDLSNINKDKIRISKQKGKSELCILSSSELVKQSLNFLFSIGDMNSYKVDANYEQIENSIETDYIVKGNDLL